MKKYTFILIFLFSSILFESVRACMLHPFSYGEYLKPHEEVVDEANIIILAEAINFIPDKKQYHADIYEYGTYHFKLTEILKGNPPSEIKIRGDNSTITYSVWEQIRIWWYNFFYHDHDEEFWVKNMGRIRGNNSMCVLVKSFEVGSTYLLISGEEDDSKNYEEITSESDKWLMFVRERLKMEPDMSN